MPRLSMYRPEKGNDYKFFDRTIFEQFTIGGTDLHIHKYLGPISQGVAITTTAAQTTADLRTLVFANTAAVLPGMFVTGEYVPKNTTVVSKTATTITISKAATSAIGSGAAISVYDDSTAPTYLNQSEKNIQDLLFLENRDRKYDTSIYTIRGHYRLSDSDFDLTQFGLFLTGDTIFLTVHLNDMIEKIGRKLMVGDVIELPHLKDLYPLDDQLEAAMKRYYVVNDATKSAEGFSPTWYPHLWRIKLQPLVDSQEYKDILNNIPISDTNSNPIGDILSTYQKFIDINDAVIAQAEVDVPMSGYDIASFYVGSGEKAPKGYLTSEGTLLNGQSVAAGVSFPTNAAIGDHFLRLDYVPNRLFKYSGKRWIKVEDAVRTNLTPGNENKTLRSGFVNNDAIRYVGSLGWDVIKVADPYIPNGNSVTIEFISPNTIITSISYVSSHRAKTSLNGTTIKNTIAEVNGNIAIVISVPLAIDDLLEYTVYEQSIPERQSLSDALRPSADN